MLNIGIIGAGTFASEHAIAINKIPGLKLSAACRKSLPELEYFSNRFGVRGYSDYRLLLSNNEIDAVLIATPHHLHTQIAIDAARAGKHILIEKPFAPGLKEVDQIIEATDMAKVKLMVGHNLQFVPATIRAKEILKSKEVGEMVMGQGTVHKFWMDAQRKDWHLSRNSAGGVLLTVGIHYIDLLTFLVDSKVKCIKASVSTKFHEQKSDDCAMLMLEYSNGVVVNITSIGFNHGVRQVEAELYCREGMLKVNSTEGVHIGREEEWQLIKGSGSESWMQESLVGEWSEFKKSIVEDRSPQVSGNHARHIMEIVLGAFESSKTGKCVYLE